MRDYGDDRGGRRGGRDGGRGGGYGGGRDGGRRDYGGHSGGSSGGSFEKPVKEGEEYDITIEAVGAKGDGIGKVNNFVVFVPGTQVGERLRIRVEKVLGKFAIAQSTGAAAGSSAPAASESSSEPMEESAEEEGSEEEAQ